MVVTKYAPNTVCHWSVWWTRMIMPVLNSGDIADEDSPYQYVMHELERRLRWGGCTCWSHRGDRSTSHTVHLQHVKMEYCTLHTTTGGFYHREDRSTSHTVHLQHVKMEYCTLHTTTGGFYHREDRSTSHTVHLQHVKMEYCTLNTTTGGFYHREDRSTSHTVHLQHVKTEYCTLNTTTGGFYHREDRSTSHTVHLQHVKMEYCTLNTTTGGFYQIPPITRTSNEQQVKRTLNHSTIQSDLWNTNIYSQGSTTTGMTYQIVNIMPGEDLLSWPREHDHLNITKTASTQVTPLLEWQHLHSM